MNAWDIQRTVMRERWRRSFVLPNYTPGKWWECDLFEITDSGYFNEYEVKVSRSDFFADAKKSSGVFPLGQSWGQPMMRENKHDLLASRSPRGPSRFWFVTPEALIKPEEVPEWAGLIEIDNRESSPVGGRLYEREIVKAPRLHRVKFPPNTAHERTVCYWRMHAEFGTSQPIGFPDDPEYFCEGSGV